MEGGGCKRGARVRGRRRRKGGGVRCKGSVNDDDPMLDGQAGAAADAQACSAAKCAFVTPLPC